MSRPRALSSAYLGEKSVPGPEKSASALLVVSSRDHTLARIASIAAMEHHIIAGIATTAAVRYGFRSKACATSAAWDGHAVPNRGTHLRRWAGGQCFDDSSHLQ